MKKFTITLSEQDIDFYKAISERIQVEAASWLRVREALRDYIENYVGVDNADDLENLHGMFLPDLVDEIVEELSAGEEEDE